MARIVRYIDKGAVAVAMTEEHRRNQIDWGSIISWLTFGGMVGGFWWWALFC